MTLRAWAIAFLFTQVIEVPIYKRGLRCSLIAAFGASAITHPIVWWGFFHPSLDLNYHCRLVSAELFAWLAEAAYFKWLIKKDRAVLWALIANAASLSIGMACRFLFGVP